MRLVQSFSKSKLHCVHRLKNGCSGSGGFFRSESLRLSVAGKSLTAAAAVCLLFSLWNASSASSSDSTKHWVGTWACAPYNALSDNNPHFNFDNKTFRYVVRVSIGGDTVRVKFSNITCTQPVAINKVNIAVSPDGTKSLIDPATATDLTFDGNADVTINAKSEVYSDPVAFDLDTSARIAITVFYGQCKAADDMTFHYGSRTNSYYLDGDKTASADFSGAQTIERWFTIAGIDVLAPKTSYAVAAIGNSITDGASLSGGLQNRWTDRFSERLLANEATKDVGVLNLGIGATLVTSPSNGAASGIDRFEHDILGQSGLHWVIILYGVNDINAGKSAGVIYDGIKQMADAAHAKDTSIKVYGGTITPNSGKLESVRSQINDMIRTSTDLDGCIDFAEAIQDPSNPSRMPAAYEGSWNDGLHPGPAGHEAMGKCIDLDMFTPPPVNITRQDDRPAVTPETIPVTFSRGNSTVSFDLQQASFVSLKVYSVSGEEIAGVAGKKLSAGRHTLLIGSGNIANRMYLYSLRVGTESVFRKMIFSGR